MSTDRRTAIGDSAEEKDYNASAQKLIDLLEFEIDRIEEARKRPGWTVWALVAAISTLLWAGLSALDVAQHFTISTIGFLFLTLTAASDALRSLLSLLTVDASNDSDNRFRPSADLFGQSRPKLVFRGIRFAFCFVLATTIVNPAYPLTIKFLRFYYGLGTVAFICGFVLSLLPLALPAKSRPSKIGLVGGILFCALLISGVIGLVDAPIDWCGCVHDLGLETCGNSCRIGYSS